MTKTSAPVYDQTDYRVRDNVYDPSGVDAAFDSGDTAQNTAGDVTVDMIARARALVKQTNASNYGTTDATTEFRWQYQNVTQSTGWVNVGDEGGGTEDVEFETPTGFTEGATTSTSLLGSGTRVNGRGCTDSISGSVTFTDLAATEAELEVAFRINSSQVNDGDTIQLRVLYSVSDESPPATTLGSYTRVVEFTVDKPAGPQTLTQTTGHDASPTFGAQTLVDDKILTQSAGHDAAPSYGTTALTHELTQSTGHDGSPSFGEVRFELHIATPVYPSGWDVPIVKSHEITLHLEQTVGHDGSPTFGSHTISEGATPLTQTSGLDAAPSYGTHTLEHHIVVGSPGSTFAPTFGSHTIAVEQELVQTTPHDASPTFGTHVLVEGVTLTQTVPLDAGPTFGTHVITVDQELVQTTTFDAGPTFGSQSLVADAVLTQSATFAAGPTFGTQLISTGDTPITVGITRLWANVVGGDGHRITYHVTTPTWTPTTTFGTEIRIGEILPPLLEAGPTFGVPVVTGGATKVTVAGRGTQPGTVSSSSFGGSGQRSRRLQPRLDPYTRSARVADAEVLHRALIHRQLRLIQGLPAEAPEGSMLVYRNGAWVLQPAP